MQRGNCSIGYNATEILEGINFEMAAMRGYETGNSIWQTVNHISFKRETVACKLLLGSTIIDENKTGFDAPGIVSAETWQETFRRF